MLPPQGKSVRNILTINPFKYLKDRLPYPFIYFNLWNSFPFIYSRLKKGLPRIGHYRECPPSPQDSQFIDTLACGVWLKSSTDLTSCCSWKHIPAQAAQHFKPLTCRGPFGVAWYRPVPGQVPQHPTGKALNILQPGDILKQALNLESPSSAIQNRHHLSILGGKSPVFPLQRQNILCLEKQLFFTPAWRFVKLFSGDVAEQMWTQNKKMKRPRFFCLKIAP